VAEADHVDWSDRVVMLKSYRKRFDLSPSLLKSLLQKNVRLGRPESAVRAALQLCVECTFVVFLRRLAIIVVEDAIMHPLFPFVVWLLIACSKELVPSKRMVSNPSLFLQTQKRSKGGDLLGDGVRARGGECEGSAAPLSREAPVAHFACIGQPLWAA